MPRTIKQQWASERCWQNKGSLAGAGARLRQIAYAHSTLPKETKQLLLACTIIDDLLAYWDRELQKEFSLIQFKHHREKP